MIVEKLSAELRPVPDEVSGKMHLAKSASNWKKFELWLDGSRKGYLGFTAAGWGIIVNNEQDVEGMMELYEGGEYYLSASDRYLTYADYIEGQFDHYVSLTKHWHNTVYWDLKSDGTMQVAGESDDNNKRFFCFHKDYPRDVFCMEPKGEYRKLTVKPVDF